GDFSPRRCSYRAVSFMMGAMSLRNRILAHCGKIHSEFEEEPKYKDAFSMISIGLGYRSNSWLEKALEVP
ncbi:MAG: hypothetical protein ACYCZQ_06990, partial [Burkholderiales bacterium]